MLYLGVGVVLGVSTMTDNDSLRVLYVSDEAYGELTMQARMLGFVHGETARGLADYVAFLMTCTMTDARPPDVAELDTVLLNEHTSPEWRMHEPRLRRKLKLTDDTLTLAAAHALSLGIAYPRSMGIEGAPCITDTTACVSALLEAIGTEWVDVKVRQHERVQG
jgi:hypothetical protein